MTKTKKIVFTRHRPLVDLLLERKIISQRWVSDPDLLDAQEPDKGYMEFDFEVIEHVDDPAQIRGRDVIGVLPLHFAAECASVTEIPLALTPEDRESMQRGDLTLPRLREIAGDARTYSVRVKAPFRMPGDCTFHGMDEHSLFIEPDDAGSPVVAISMHDEERDGECLGTALLQLDVARAAAHRILDCADVQRMRG